MHEILKYKREWGAKQERGREMRRRRGCRGGGRNQPQQHRYGNTIRNSYSAD